MNMVLVSFQGPKGKKKGQKSSRKKNGNKSKASSRKNSKKSNLPQGSNDLSAKLLQTMEKHKEVTCASFQIHLQLGILMNCNAVL